MSKTIESWDLDEVCIWLNCIGLGEKVDPFRENTVDGETLTSLSNDDLTAELGLTNLQAKKVLRQIDETKEMIALREGSGAPAAAAGDGGDSEELQLEIQQLKDKLEAKDATIASLEEENGSLKGEVEKLQGQLEELSQAPREAQPAAQYQYPPQGYAYPPPQGYPPQQAYPPQEQQQAPPPEPEHHEPQGPGVIGGAARGAAGGALKGAVMGAILPGMDAGDGAAAGAAVGALGGAGRGLFGRRRG